MKKSVGSFVKVCTVAALVTFSYSGKVLAGTQEAESTKTHKTMQHGNNEHMNMPVHDHKNMGSENDSKPNEKNASIVRKGTINVEAIDKNKDGKVYQDQMDWNVISDKAGSCPLCKMTLEEVTVKQAKENLKKNGFKVK